METDEEKITGSVPAGQPQPQDFEKPETTRPPGMPPLPESEPEEYDFEEDEDRRVRGWLALFLWVGIGLGTLVNIAVANHTARTFANLGEDNTSVMVWCYSAALAVLGIYTIVGFYRKQPDAVMCAKAYTLMMAADGVASLVISSRFHIPGMAGEGFRPIIWGAIWYVFLLCSTRVEAVIPSDTRKMSWPAGLLMLVCAVTFVAFNVQMHNLAGDIADVPKGQDNEVLTTEPWQEYDEEEIDEAGISYQEEPLSYEEQADDYIAALQLPQTTSPGVSLTKAERNGKTITYVLQIFKCDVTDLDKSQIPAMMNDIKQEVLRTLKRSDLSYLDHLSIKGGFSGCYKYVDVYGKYIGSYTITAEELKKLKD